MFEGKEGQNNSFVSQVETIKYKLEREISKMLKCSDEYEDGLLDGLLIAARIIESAE